MLVSWFDIIFLLLFELPLSPREIDFVPWSSNVTAGRLFGIPLKGTHSHAFVSSYMVHTVIVFTGFSFFWNSEYNLMPTKDDIKFGNMIWISLGNSVWWPQSFAFSMWCQCTTHFKHMITKRFRQINLCNHTYLFR